MFGKLFSLNLFLCYEISSIITESWKIDAELLTGNSHTIWSRFYTADENNLIPIVNRCLIVDTRSAGFNRSRLW